MRKLVIAVVAILAATTMAAADPAGDVTSLVKRNLDAIAANSVKSYAATLVKDAVVYDGNGHAFEVSPTGDPTMDLLYRPFNAGDGTAKHKLGKVVVSVDAASGVAWFHGPFDATFTTSAGANPCGGGGGPMTIAMRVSGVAVNADGGWKLAAVMYTHPLADGDLIDAAQSRGVVMPTDPPTIVGDDAVGKAVAGWFPNLSQAKTAGATVVASGSAPGEFFDATTLPKYVKAWDTLGVKASRIDVRMFGNGKLAFVHADTQMPIKKSNFASPLTMAAIAVKEGDAWRWVSLQFAPALRY
jgi:hypothetical protein